MIFISKSFNAHQCLKELAKLNGFNIKSNCCYRIVGDGILQLLKFEYEPRLLKHELRMGLYSLYSELHPHWLTPSGCILRYPVVALAELAADCDASVDTQITILKEAGLLWLDSINTQRNLIDSLCDIELCLYGKIQWVDSLKLAPFLLSGDYASAERVITSILKQHVGPHYWTTEQWTRDDYEIYKRRFPNCDTQLLELHKWVSEGCSDAVNDYLYTNYVVNRDELQKKKLIYLSF